MLLDLFRRRLVRIRACQGKRTIVKAKFIKFHESEKLDDLFQASHKEPVVFFKHSTTCAISANLINEIAKIDSKVFVMVVQNARRVSDEIAKRTGIKHESPQTIIVKNGRAIYHASHYDIVAYEIENILSKEKVTL